MSARWARPVRPLSVKRGSKICWGNQGLAFCYPGGGYPAFRPKAGAGCRSGYARTTMNLCVQACNSCFELNFNSSYPHAHAVN